MTKQPKRMTWDEEQQFWREKVARAEALVDYEVVQSQSMLDTFQMGTT